MPVFVAPEPLVNERLPALGRHTVDGLLREAEELAAAGVPALLLFGVPEEKDDEATGAWAEDGVVQQALRALRRRFPELLLLTDVCLVRTRRTATAASSRTARSRTTRRSSCSLAMAVSHAEAGADAVCPSDMMDGRVGAVREALDDAGSTRRPIVAYSAKYASAFYGPFREAADSTPAFGDRRVVPDGSRQRPRGAARVRARPRGGRRHAHGEAGAAVPRRHPRRARALRRRRSPRTASPASTRW